jgi:hypothetical protein
MPVLLRCGNEAFYKKVGGGVLTLSEKEVADKLDAFLRAEVPKIEATLPGSSQKRGCAYYYELGRKLRLLWEEARRRFNLPDAEISLFLEAAGQYLQCKFSERTLKRHPLYMYAYRLAEIPPALALQETWRTWVEVFDSSFRRDMRIIDWLTERQRKAERVPLRVLFRLIRQRFRKIDTTMWKKEELYQELDRLLYSLEEIQKSKRNGQRIRATENASENS